MSYTLHHGEALSVLGQMPSASVDAVVTDPPYSSGGMVRGDRAQQSTRDKYVSSNAATRDDAHEFTGERGFAHWCALWLAECHRITTPGGIAAVWVDWRNLPTLTDSMQAGGWVWQGIVPWVKSNGRPRPGGFRNQAEYVVWGSHGPLRKTDDYLVGILSAAIIPSAKRVHVAEKPVDVLAELVKAAPPGGVVLDPFMGSGSTGVAALREGRRFIGVEMSATHYATAERRLAEAPAPAEALPW